MAVGDFSGVQRRPATSRIGIAGGRRVRAAVAVDADGNRSPRSAPLTFTTRPVQAEPTCRVQFRAYGRQIQTNVTIENMTAATIVENWTVTFTLFPCVIG